MEAQESDRPGRPAAGAGRHSRRSGPERAAGNQAGTTGGSGPSGARDKPLINPRLADDPRARAWFTRIVIGAAVFFGFLLGLDWRFAVSATALYLIGDVIFRSKTKTVVPASVRVTAAQRSTQRRLKTLQPAGYYALNTCQIPGTKHIIDHLVVGPAGVFAIDSERLDKRLAIQIRDRGLFYHGPASQIDRINHAIEEATQAATLISAELGRKVQVQPAMIIYGPEVPWKVMRFDGVDVFGGGRIGHYFRRKTKQTAGNHLTPESISQIYNAAAQALPPLDGE